MDNQTQAQPQQDLIKLALDALYDGKSSEAQRYIAQSGAFDWKDEKGNGWLHHAAWMGDNKTLEMLVAHAPQLDLNARNNEGNTPLHLAAKAHKGDPEATIVMLRAIDPHTKLLNHNGETPIAIAMRFDYPKRVELLETKNLMDEMLKALVRDSGAQEGKWGERAKRQKSGPTIIGMAGS